MSAITSVNFGFRRRLPLIFQAESAECGLACLAMVAAFHGRAEALVELRQRFGVSLTGVRLADLTRIADRMNMNARAVRIDLHELKELQLPCVLHWDLSHFVVLKEVSARGIVIHDPALGLRRLNKRQTSEHFSGVALELTPTSVFKPKKAEPSLSLNNVVGRLSGYKKSLVQLLSLALAIECFSIAQPFFMQWVVDHALISGDRDLLITLAIGFGLLMVTQLVFSTMRGWMLMVLTTSLKIQGRGSLFGHLLRLPAAFFESRHLGDVVSRFGSMETIQQALTTDLIEVLLDGVFAIATLAIMYLLSPTLATLVLAMAVLYGLLRWAMYTPLQEASMETIIWAAKRDNHFLETIRGVKTIKLLGGQETRRSHWLNLLVETINRDLTAQKLRLTFRLISGLLQTALSVAIVLLGAVYVLESVFSVGMLLAFIAYKGQFVTRITDLIDKFVDLRMLRLHSERLADIVLTVPEKQDDISIAVGDLRPEIEVKNLKFRYSEQDPWVLDHVSFKIRPGESVAIVGASGCGKSTLLKILSSLLVPTSGEILVGGEPLAMVGLQNYRAMLSVVMQDDQLFGGSISDNICFFAERKSRTRVEECAKLAAIHDDIKAMPMSYESLIGDMGTSLSGGQKQRVLLARALYRSPKILLLDEATSHLDVKLENAVNSAIKSASMTRIIVAHRPETILSAERVIRLEQGRIISDTRAAKQGRASARLFSQVG
jgi:ATP-binding cassette, subfamily B, bacterial CvaB/MchF/RaxB